MRSPNWPLCKRPRSAVNSDAAWEMGLGRADVGKGALGLGEGRGLAGMLGCLPPAAFAPTHPSFCPVRSSGGKGALREGRGGRPELEEGLWGVEAAADAEGRQGQASQPREGAQPAQGLVQGRV